MDDPQYTSETLILWAKRLQRALTEANIPGAPTLDLEWLLLRCDDTLKYSGADFCESATQLMADAKDFLEEFPGVISGDLVAPGDPGQGTRPKKTPENGSTH
jgi:hypothetical protein